MSRVEPFEKYQPRGNSHLPPVTAFARDFTLPFLHMICAFRQLQYRQGPADAEARPLREVICEWVERVLPHTPPLTQTYLEGTLAPAFWRSTLQVLHPQGPRSTSKNKSQKKPVTPPKEKGGKKSPTGKHDAHQDHDRQLKAALSKERYYSWKQDCAAAQAAAYAESSLFASVTPVLNVSVRDRYVLAARLHWFFVQGQGETVFKYLTCRHSAAVLQQELPKLPDCLRDDPLDTDLYRGITKRRQARKHILGPNDKRRLAFGNALLMSKKSTDVVNAKFVSAELEAHQKRLTADPKPAPCWLESALERTVKEVFPSARKPWHPSRRMENPSERAHFTKGRAEGGAFSFFYSRGEKWYDEDEDERGRSVLTVSEVISLSAFPDALPELLSFVEGPLGVAEIRGYGDMLWDRVVDAFEPDNPDVEVPHATPSPVLEACKVRMITKGPERLQYLGRYVQKFLWQTLSRHPTFRLIGQPISSDDIEDFWSRAPVGAMWVSGDYKAATDYLSSEATNLCWELICERSAMPAEFQEWGYKILTEHVLHYDGVGVAQRNGQLMGSVISFPILCLINAAVNRHVMEEAYGVKLSLEDTGMLINGDDCLIHLPPEQKFYELWQQCTSAVGLEMSLGKNYWSDKFVVINSRMYYPHTTERRYQVLLTAPDGKSTKVYSWYFDAPLDQCCDEPVLPTIPRACQVRFLNPGNLHGVGRVQHSDDRSQTGFISRLDALVESAPPLLREDLINTWVYLNAHRLQKISQPGQSWFLPRFAGGLGLLRPADFTIRNVPVVARQVMRFLCSLDGQEAAVSYGLETADAPAYAVFGSRYLGRVCRKVGLHPLVVREDVREEYLRLADQRTAYTQFALKGFERATTEIRKTFSKLVKRSAKFAPADGFPGYDRVVLRPACHVPAPRAGWSELFARISSPLQKQLEKNTDFDSRGLVLLGLGSV